jgi:hypothetical protein
MVQRRIIHQNESLPALVPVGTSCSKNIHLEFHSPSEKARDSVKVKCAFITTAPSTTGTGTVTGSVPVPVPVLCLDSDPGSHRCLHWYRYRHGRRHRCGESSF